MTATMFVFWSGHLGIWIICLSADVKDFNEDIADKIRQWAKIPPYPHCGAILLRGMSHEFGCRVFAGRIRNHLPLPMGRELLDDIVELTQQFPTFHGL
jgi:hypothetical protein